MINQPSFRPQRGPRPLPEGALALTSEPPMTAVQAAALTNPVQATPASAARGQALFQIYCFPCHGSAGKGNGRVAAKITRPADLTAAKYIASPDGFFYHVIRAGNGALMPPQAESMSPAERWDVVNYIRQLEKP
jgi:mono/diheme cytochrome c family protein